MTYVADAVRNDGLNTAIANVDTIHLLASDTGASYPGSDLGSATVTLNADEDGDVDGRKTVCPQTSVTPGATGTATHWALTDGTSVVYASGAFSTSYSVTSGVARTVEAFDAIIIRDAT